MLPYIDSERLLTYGHSCIAIHGWGSHALGRFKAHEDTYVSQIYRPKLAYMDLEPASTQKWTINPTFVLYIPTPTTFCLVTVN